ncbi:Uncharacterized protein ToN1_32530 [Aromatoleum petrolei]|nr:Uncharacterized protein ToN1_32530 [Aromatoleum petrolei]
MASSLRSDREAGHFDAGFRLDQARGHHVDADVVALLAAIDRCRFRHHVDAGLGGAVCGEVRGAAEGGHRAHVDDLAAAGALHPADRRLGADEGRVEVDRHDPGPLVECDALDVVVGASAGVVHEDVEAAVCLALLLLTEN